MNFKMGSTDMHSQDHDSLQETATSLIKALGVDMAIQICRSNYWYGVLQLILDREDTSEDNTVSVISPLRRHSLPNAPYEMDQEATEVEKVAIAA